MTLVPKPIGTSFLAISGVIFLLGLFFLSPKNAIATSTFKPELTWQRSLENNDSVVHETSVGTLVAQALALPLSAAQVVWDNGQFTPEPNKSQVSPGVIWASWPQYSWTGNPYGCGPIYDLRHFRATFNLTASQVPPSGRLILKSPSYPGEILPINDNLYTYLNGHLLGQRGTSYGAAEMSGIFETDHWVGDGNFGTEAVGFLKTGENVLDLVAGEWCRWGGLGKLELVIESAGPPPVEPFLELPWDYQGKGLNFNEAALAITSYFDHEYPLLSSGLGEPAGKGNSIIFFRGGQQNLDLNYSSHDGYDYAKLAKVNIGDPVLAAADGCASYSYNSATGNMIRVDHRNGYQTWYMHMQADGLVTKTSSPCVDVHQGQAIGKVGATGNVVPKGDTGAHIHFSVVEDKNKDGSFFDNVPDGMTDPFGWQSKDTDPWENYAFVFGGQNRTGNKSNYLWKHKIENLDASLTANGGVFKNDRYTFSFPPGATEQNLNLQLQSTPSITISNILSSIGSTLSIFTQDTLGNFVTQFQNAFTLSVDFSQLDLSHFDTSTISIYSSSDGTSWIKEPTIVDLTNKTAQTQASHLSQFALIAERKDSDPPTTTAQFSGTAGSPGWFSSNVTATLIADDHGGLGVDYTLSKADAGDWGQYFTPVVFTDEGKHKIEFYSADNDGNLEIPTSVEINIDTTMPEVKIFFDKTNKKIAVEGVDANTTTVTEQNGTFTISDPAGNQLVLKTKLIVNGNQNYMNFVDFPKTQFYVATGTGTTIQFFQLNGAKIVIITFDAKNNQSVIQTVVSGKLTKETRSGQVFLQIYTEKGSLKWRII